MTTYSDILKSVVEYYDGTNGKKKIKLTKSGLISPLSLRGVFMYEYNKHAEELNRNITDPSKKKFIIPWNRLNSKKGILVKRPGTEEIVNLNDEEVEIRYLYSRIHRKPEVKEPTLDVEYYTENETKRTEITESKLVSNMIPYTKKIGPSTQWDTDDFADMYGSILTFNNLLSNNFALMWNKIYLGDFGNVTRKDIVDYVLAEFPKAIQQYKAPRYNVPDTVLRFGLVLLSFQRKRDALDMGDESSVRSGGAQIIRIDSPRFATYDDNPDGGIVRTISSIFNDSVSLDNHLILFKILVMQKHEQLYKNFTSTYKVANSPDLNCLFKAFYDGTGRASDKKKLEQLKDKYPAGTLAGKDDADLFAKKAKVNYVASFVNGEKLWSREGTNYDKTLHITVQNNHAELIPTKPRMNTLVLTNEAPADYAKHNGIITVEIGDISNKLVRKNIKDVLVRSTDGMIIKSKGVHEMLVEKAKEFYPELDESKIWNVSNVDGLYHKEFKKLNFKQQMFKGEKEIFMQKSCRVVRQFTRQYGNSNVKCIDRNSAYLTMKHVPMYNEYKVSLGCVRCYSGCPADILEICKNTRSNGAVVINNVKLLTRSILSAQLFQDGAMIAFPLLDYAISRGLIECNYEGNDFYIANVCDDLNFIERSILDADEITEDFDFSSKYSDITRNVTIKRHVKETNRKMIGRLTLNSSSDTIYTINNVDEFCMLAESFEDKGVLNKIHYSLDENGDFNGGMLGVMNLNTLKAPHTRASILAYNYIAVLDQTLKYNQDDIVKIWTDCIGVKWNGTSESFKDTYDGEMWKDESDKMRYEPFLDISLDTVEKIEKYESPKWLCKANNDSLYRFNLVDGIAGGGKSTISFASYPGTNNTFTTYMNCLAQNFRDDSRKMESDKVSTLCTLFRLSPGHREFKENVVVDINGQIRIVRKTPDISMELCDDVVVNDKVKKTREKKTMENSVALSMLDQLRNFDPYRDNNINFINTEVVKIDEFGYINDDWMKEIVRILDVYGKAAIFTGDSAQLEPCEGKRCFGTLLNFVGEMHGKRTTVTEDHRATCETLKKLKSDIRGRPNLKGIMEVEKLIGRTSDWRCENHQFGDAVICATRKARKFVNELLFTKYRNDIIDGKKRSVFPVMQVKTNKTKHDKVNGELFDLDVSKYVKVIGGVEVLELPKHIELAFALTIHKVQGLGLKNRKIFIVVDRISNTWADGIIYSAVGRSETIEQLELVSLDLYGCDDYYDLEELENLL